MLKYHFPPIELLQRSESLEASQRNEYAQYLHKLLESNLKAFKVDATVDSRTFNDFAVLFHIKMGYGESVRKLQNLREDLEVHLGTAIEILIDGENQDIILAAKRSQRPVLGLRNIISCEKFQNAESKLVVAAGVDLLGSEFLIDIKKAKNLLIAGTTGSGKSTFISDIILSFLYKATPEELELILIDPKQVELGPYNGIPHLLTPVIVDQERALQALYWVQNEAYSRRLKIKNAGCESVEEYYTKTGERLPRLVVIIDEYMELMFRAPSVMEGLVRQIAGASQIAGVHLIIATQRPSKDVITPQIKSYIPCRASFTVVDKRESKIAINRTGAERLLNFGDMIYSVRDEDTAVHAQAAFVSCEEIDAVISFLRDVNREINSSSKVSIPLVSS